MTSEPVVGVVFGRPVVGKTILSYICLPFHSPTHASQLTGTASYYRFRCHYPLITYLRCMQGRTLKCILSTYYTIYHKVKWPFAIEWKVKREVMPIPPTFCFRHSNYTSTIVTMATIKKDLKICTEFKVQLFINKHKSPDLHITKKRQI